jgi:hypothetical protein
MRFSTLVPFVLVLSSLVACKRRSAPSPAPTTRKTAAPPPAPTQPPIRDNSTVSDPKSGVSVRVRLFVSTLTSGDPLRFGFQLAPEKAIEKQQLDWSEAVQSLVFELKAPSGKKNTLEVREKYPRAFKMPLSEITQAITLDATGLTELYGHLAWKEEKRDWLGEIGKYSLTITGSLATEQQKLDIASKPIELEVVAHAAQHQSLAELERSAAALVGSKNGGKTPAKSYSPTIDDVKGNLWTRFQIDNPNEGYDIEVVEVLVDPSGKEVAFDQYRHFTCIAANTPIATPDGEVPIERLRAGAEVVSWDPETKRRTTSIVEQTTRSFATELVVLGALRITGNHPIFADDRWQAARDVRAGSRLFDLSSSTLFAEPAYVSERTDVFDLSVSAPHTYFAAGVLVHNKAMHVPIGGNNQPWRGWFYRRAAQL